jgi:polysaccharide export outer membrane protein
MAGEGAHGAPLKNVARATIVGLAALALAGCAALPRGGPLTSDMTAEDEAGLEGLVAPLTAEAAVLAANPERRGFPQAFFAAPEIDPARLGVDDVLDIAIWETEEAGLFGGSAGAARLEGVTIDGDGRIFVPFVGPMRAAGLTPSSLRERIRQALEPLTLSPQVDVRLREARSRTLTVQGAVARPGPYPIERAATRLTPMLALAGGATLPPEQVEVVVRRRGESGSTMLEDLYADPALDIALAPHDIIVLNAIRERFVVLGATRVQGEITFPTRDLNLLRAIGAARGLIDFDADPSGVFVFRWEDPAVAGALLAGAEPPGVPQGPGRPIVYRLDMKEPGALFVAQTFELRDGDAIFVTNAPLTELRKFLQLFTAVLTPVQQGSALAP